jgi:hypothetical protein
LIPLFRIVPFRILLIRTSPFLAKLLTTGALTTGALTAGLGMMVRPTRDLVWW